MRYHKLDLNLLVVFDKLMSERSVSQAAAQLNLSQPAISNALSRLRRHFEDELFLQVGRRMAPTPFAEALRDGVRETLESLQQIATTRATFDAATAERTFTIVTSDQAYLALIIPAIRRLAPVAPGLTIRAVLTSDQRADLLRRGVVDFIVNPKRSLVEEHPHLCLFDDEMICLTWTGSDVPAALDLEQFCQVGHVETTMRPMPAPIDIVLAEQGLSRRIAAYAPTFVLGVLSLIGTQHVSFIGSRPASVLQTWMPVRRVAVPIALTSLTLTLQWHRTREADPGVLWMRDFLLQVAQEDCRPLE